MTTGRSVSTRDEQGRPLDAILARIPGRAGRLLGAGLFIEIAGIVGDAYWHTVLHIHDVGSVPPPHWVILLGMVIALGGVLKGRAISGETRRSIYTIGVIAAVGQLLGAAWDNYLHLNGNEPAVWALPHALYRAGFLVLVTLGVVLVVRWRL